MRLKCASEFPSPSVPFAKRLFLLGQGRAGWLTQAQNRAGLFPVHGRNPPRPSGYFATRIFSPTHSTEEPKIVMGALGHKVFEPLMSQTSEAEKDEPLLHMDYKKGHATGKRTSDGFVILKGSTINPATTKSCPENILKARQKYADRISDTYELTMDILMTSASTAAGFIGGASLSGNALWHDEQGKSLKQIEG